MARKNIIQPFGPLGSLLGIIRNDLVRLNSSAIALGDALIAVAPVRVLHTDFLILMCLLTIHNSYDDSCRWRYCLQQMPIELSFLPPSPPPSLRMRDWIIVYQVP